ncbi:MAG: roadblock/LC7 domain-containing protein, partial [Methanocaldococcus sp.]
NNVKKIIIQKDDEYIYIYPLKFHNENLYVVIESKIMLEIVEEREILKKIYNVLKKYFTNIESIEKEISEEKLLSSI